MMATAGDITITVEHNTQNFSALFSTMRTMVNLLLCVAPLLVFARLAAGVTPPPEPEIKTDDGHIVLVPENGKDVQVQLGDGTISVAALAANLTALASRLRAAEDKIASLEGFRTKVLSKCAVGSVVAGYEPDGTPACVEDADTVLSPSEWQKRVSATCASDTFVTGIGEDGTPSCSAPSQIASLVKTAPTVIFSTGTAGQYDLRKIFDDARVLGLEPQYMRCVLKTNNGAHWTGREFSIIVNYYLETASPAHAGFPHSIYDVVTLDAGSSGCTAGLTSFVVTSTTGYFTFDPGNCFQQISLTCQRFA